MDDDGLRSGSSAFSNRTVNCTSLALFEASSIFQPQPTPRGVGVGFYDEKVVIGCISGNRMRLIIK